jgi:hypothetical protein
MKPTNNDLKIIRDAAIATNDKINNQKVEGSDVLKNTCFIKAKLGKDLIRMYENGEPILEQSNDILKNMLHDLTHLQQHVVVEERCFTGWDESPLANSGLSEAMYLISAKSVKENHEICQSDLFNNLVYDIALKLENGNENNVQQCYNKVQYEVAKEWYNAGLLKSLKAINSETGEQIHSNANIGRIRRNSPCPCLSSKKYKKCCGQN